MIKVSRQAIIRAAAQRVLRSGFGGKDEVMQSDTAKYNKSLDPPDRKICDLLARAIGEALPEAENRIWHAHPVWFLDGNPVVGYSKMKQCVRLLFWSGQSFKEQELKKEGSF